MKTIVRICLISICLLGFSTMALSQSVNNKSIIIEKSIISESSIYLKSINNVSGYDVEIIIRNEQDNKVTDRINKGEKRSFDIECSIIQAIPIGAGSADAGGGTIWSKAKTLEEWRKEHPIIETPEPVKDTVLLVENENTNKVELVKASTLQPKTNERKPVTKEAVIFAFTQALESDKKLSSSSIIDDANEILNHIENIKKNDDKSGYIEQNKLNDYVKSEARILEEYRNNVEKRISDYLANYPDGMVVCKDSLEHIVERRIEQREKVLASLKSTIDYVGNVSIFDIRKLDKSSLINLSAICLVAIMLVVCFILLVKRKNAKRKSAEINRTSTNETSPAIVVRRKTTSILKKQSLEDVIDNSSYLKIECNNFCNDSAVKRMYIKNTCIKDIYNMYAEDLRNPENPKEDGCMVLGRWVYDDMDNEYYVSLEEIVKPGDDAVFQEYELNFGGKIKLKVAERLRRLRGETNLQYDLTCWVHSHPGLGVFFSNSDSSVQMQLKHPSHPNFLTAIVIDILTPDQELGIFTFKHDGSINSKNDLKKMYSLEEMYKWAVESDRNSYRPEDYYNILSKAVSLGTDCQGIQLNNGAIIDLSSLAVEAKTGLVGWAHGFQTKANRKNEFVVCSISTSNISPDNDLLGCVVIGTHCSIPSIRKAISDYVNNVKFVIFYSITEEVVTVIPVDDKQLCMDEKFYSEEKLEDLKIWTRRKR